MSFQAVADALAAIRGQLEGAAQQVERDAEVVVRDACDMHRLVRCHRENALQVLERLVALRDLSELATRDPEELVEQIFGSQGQQAPAGEAYAFPHVLLDRIRAQAAEIGDGLRSQDAEHQQMVGHTRPLVASLQLFDGIRQLVEHSAEAIGQLEELARRAADGDEARFTPGVERLLANGLRRIYFTAAERRLLAQHLSEAFDPDEHLDPRALPPVAAREAG